MGGIYIDTTLDQPSSGGMIVRVNNPYRYKVLTHTFKIKVTAKSIAPFAAQQFTSNQLTITTFCDPSSTQSVIPVSIVSLQTFYSDKDDVSSRAFTFNQFTNTQMDCPITKYEITTSDKTVLHTDFSNSATAIATKSAILVDSHSIQSYTLHILATTLGGGQFLVGPYTIEIVCGINTANIVIPAISNPYVYYLKLSDPKVPRVEDIDAFGSNFKTPCPFMTHTLTSNGVSALVDSKIENSVDLSSVAGKMVVKV